MARTVEDEGWEDLLAAAESITEEQYDEISSGWAPRRVQAPVDAPAGFAFVPLRMSPAMERAVLRDDWQWADLLSSTRPAAPCRKAAAS